MEYVESYKLLCSWIVFVPGIELRSIWPLRHIPSPIFAFYLETASHLLKLTELMIVLPHHPNHCDYKHAKLRQDMHVDFYNHFWNLW